MTIAIGVDVGTSATKAIAVDAADGSVVAASERAYPMRTPRPGWAEQDPSLFVAAAEDALAEVARALGDRRRDVRAIGLAGQMHSAVLLDEARRVLGPAILWCDTRTTEECREIERRLGGTPGLRRTVKNLALEGFTLPKLLWLRRHEPELFARVRTVVMPRDLVGERLTGELATDVSDASGTLAFDPGSRAWSLEALAAVDVDPSLFPRAQESVDVLGALRADVAGRVGLPAGISVVHGAADNAAGAVGMGIVRTGRAMVSVGTSGVVLAHTDRLRVDDELRLHTFASAVPGASYVMGVMLMAGGALRWFRDVVARRPYDEILALAAGAPPGSGGVVFLPYLMGERTPHHDPAARGVFFGLSAATSIEHLARAVVEGISFGLADALDLVRALEPSASADLRLSGGGARSATFAAILADVFGAPVSRTSSTEGAALGAALLASVAAGAHPSVAAASDAVVRVVDSIAPSTSQAVARYTEVRAIYKDIYGDLRARFAAAGKAS